MYVCVPCKRSMRCSKNGVGAEYGPGHVYPGDEFTCPQCGHKILSTNGKPIHDPEHKTQDEYLQMDEK